jgi:pyruvate/2-oxoglutarate dehydrogenase complex dihydrolipoamide acyltransferase (E2) component
MAMNETRRKLAIATWSPPSEGNIYGKLTLDAEEAIAFLDHLRRTTGEKVSFTHLVGKAVAEALAAAPGLNGRIHLGRYIPYDDVAMMYLVAIDGGADLGGKKISRAHEKSIVETARELSAAAEKLRKGQDEDFEKSKGALKILPTFLLRWVVWLTGWLATSWGLSIPTLGVRPFPFGSCVITSVGMFGLDEAFAPHTPFARVPVLILVGAAKPRAVVHDGAITMRHQITITATIDHRFVDGMEGARLAKIVRERVENPWPMIGLQQRPALEELGISGEA